MKNVEWRQVEGYSNYIISEYGDVKNIKTNKLLKRRTTKDGYQYYRLCERGIQSDFRVHRLVAKMWLDNPMNLETVNHKDGNKTNNHVSNLEWMDRHSQLEHAYNLGLKKAKVGTDSNLSKATVEQVKYIRDKYDNHKGSMYGFYANLSRETGLSQTLVTRIAKRKSYFNI